MTGRSPRVQRARWASWALIAGAIVNASFLLEGYLGTRLDRSISFVSELAARGEPAAVFFRLSDLVAGILLGVGGLLAYTLLPRNAALRAGVILSICFAGLTALDSFLPLDCPATSDPACRAAEEANLVSWQHQLHNLTGALEGALAPVALLLIAIGLWQLRRRGTLPEQWEGVWQSLVIMGLTYAVFSGAIAVLYTDRLDGVGLWQRVQIVLYCAAMFTLGLAMRQYREPPVRTAAAHAQLSGGHGDRPGGLS